MTVVAMACCYGCGRVFAFDPDRVPTVAVNDRREPLCLGCVRALNPHLEACGLAPLVTPAGAYLEQHRC